MLLELDPVPMLLRRVRAELADAFRANRPIRVSRAPGRLDVMGGIAEYTGSVVCSMMLDRAAAVAIQERDDRELQVFSFNLLDEHQPFTLRIPLDALARNSAETLRKEFAEPGRAWAAHPAGCLYLLHERGLVDLLAPTMPGLNIALYSSLPVGLGMGSSAAIEVATMMNLVEHAAVRHRLDPLVLAEMCQSMKRQIVGVTTGIADQLVSCAGQAGSLHRFLSQPCELQRSLAIPAGMRVLGIHSGVTQSDSHGQSAKIRCAAFMGHKIILEKMRDMGRASHRILERDPMNGYLANLDPEDYKKFFRPYLPESLKGGEFLMRFGSTIDSISHVIPDCQYPVRSATDHHVLEAMRVRNFVRFMEQAGAMPADSRERGLLLDKAGHLMYASHLSYANDASLSTPECDLLVKLVREREPAGLYGAKITGHGGGGTVAVLAEDSPRADQALQQVVLEFENQTGKRAELLKGSSPGAWETGTVMIQD